MYGKKIAPSKSKKPKKKPIKKNNKQRPY